MYKLLIVDDEKEIREGLASWHWEQLDMTVAGCCSHGLEALQFVDEHPVDVIISDIRMPFMDGIALMTALNQRYSFIRVVILSGYSDFEYARMAVQQGAVDYLLKPIQFQALQDTFSRLLQRLEEDKQSELRVSVLKRKAEMLTHVLRKDFLRRLFHERLTEEEREQESSEAEVWLECESFTVAVFRPDRIGSAQPEMKEKEAKLLAFAMDNLLSDLWDDKGHGYHWVNERMAEAYVLSVKPDAIARFEELLPQWRKYRGLFKSAISAGAGPTVRTANDIYLSAQAAMVALKDHSGGTLAVYGFGHEALEVSKAVKETVSSLMFVTEDQESNGWILGQAKQYIRDNYFRSLTLKEVADHVHVSPSHLFALFKGSGETFLKYLTAMRLQKAIELLKGTSLKVYEIVERIGYADPAYFAELMKKHTGKTPNEIRGKMR